MFGNLTVFVIFLLFLGVDYVYTVRFLCAFLCLTNRMRPWCTTRISVNYTGCDIVLVRLLCATLYPYLMCDIVSVFNVLFHVAQVQESNRRAFTNVGHKNAHRKRTQKTGGGPACRLADRPDMQVRRRFLSHTNVACLCDKQYSMSHMKTPSKTHRVIVPLTVFLCVLHHVKASDYPGGHTNFP
jgi:hypothetical protein